MTFTIWQYQALLLESLGFLFLPDVKRLTNPVRIGTQIRSIESLKEGPHHNFHIVVCVACCSQAAHKNS